MNERRLSPGRRQIDSWKFLLFRPVNWLFGIIGVLVVISLIGIVGQVQARSRADRRADRAITAEMRLREATEARIDLLRGRIDDLIAASGDNRSEIARLVAEVQALQNQIRDSGGRPVVPVSTSTTSTTVGQVSTSTTRPAPTTTTTTRLCVSLVCIGGINP